MKNHGTTATAVAAPPRSVSYCRVSTERQAQEGVSLDVQREACREYAQAQGWVLTEQYVDDESSYAPREAYSRMIQDAIDGEFDHVLVYDFSRFGRDIAQAPADVARLELLGIQVVSVSSPHAGRLERGISFVLNDWYSYELGKKVKPSHIRRVQDGLWVSRPPVGYVLEPVGDARPSRKLPKRLAPDPEHAPKVARLFTLYAVGTYSLNALVREADRMGLTSHSGRPIARSNIATILRNPAYIGDIVYNRRSLSKFEKKGLRPQNEWVIAKGQHEPIVDHETFHKCAELLDRHQTSYGVLTHGRPLLTGVLYCGDCGSKMVGRPRWRKAGKYGQGPGRYYYVTYRCYHYETFRDCPNDTYHGGAGIEKWVKAQLMRLPITAEDRKAARVETQQLLRGQMGNVEAQRKSLQDQRDAHVADLKALSWRLVREEIPAPLYAEMRQEKETQIQPLDRRLAELEGAQTLDARTTETLAFLETVDWADFDAQAWKEAIAVLVDRVVVEDRRRYRIEWRPGVAELLPQ